MGERSHTRPVNLLQLEVYRERAVVADPPPERIRLSLPTKQNTPAVAEVRFIGSGGLLPLKSTKLVFLI